MKAFPCTGHFYVWHLFFLVIQGASQNPRASRRPQKRDGRYEQWSKQTDAPVEEPMDPAKDAEQSLPGWIRWALAGCLAQEAQPQHEHIVIVSGWPPWPLIMTRRQAPPSSTTCFHDSYQKKFHSRMNKDSMELVAIYDNQFHPKMKSKVCPAVLRLTARPEKYIRKAECRKFFADSSSGGSRGSVLVRGRSRRNAGFCVNSSPGSVRPKPTRLTAQGRARSPAKAASAGPVALLSALKQIVHALFPMPRGANFLLLIGFPASRKSSFLTFHGFEGGPKRVSVLIAAKQTRQ